MASVATRQRDPRSEAVAGYLKKIDPTELDIWNDLDVLSTHTRVEFVEVDPDAIVVENSGHFSGAFNIYVSLQYGANNDEGFTTSDSFLVSFEGHFDNDVPVIDKSDVDTSSFYED